MTTRKIVLAHFKKVDPVLYGAAQSLPSSTLVQIEKRMRHRTPTKDLFDDLCSTIIGQQLSGKAADTIYQRFKKLCTRVTPGVVAKKSLEDFRAVGISYAKGRALHDLAFRTLHKQLPLKKLSTMTDEEVRHALIAVRGIGPWSAEMILMFSLGYEDIFSFGDLGLQNACMKLYKLKTRPHKEKLEKLSKPWAPYRTWAARILWKYLDEGKGRSKTK